MLTDRTQRRPQAARRLVRVGLACLLLLGAAPIPATAAARGYELDLGTRADFVAQSNFVQCVGASMQMMLNMIQPGADRSAATQLRLQKLAREWSGQRPDGRERQGASVRGWASGLNLLDAGPYQLVGATSLEEALLTAAKAMRRTGKPVGLLMWRGRHAWVMSGFRATGDPLVAGTQVTAVFVEDPLYPYGSSVWGPSPVPGAALTPEELGRQFVPRRTSSANRWGMAGLSGKYVLVLPYLIDLRTQRRA
ncbi:MAG: hypothetical protein Q7S35_08405 [Candidatus Limnocylindrales bacterium]|nr:hypothetical protein [Candidatus Limnocylindrales bacterium]